MKSPATAAPVPAAPVHSVATPTAADPQPDPPPSASAVCGMAENSPGLAPPPEDASVAPPGLAGSSTVRAVILEVVPPDGGQANRTVSGPDLVTGMHLSGDSPPFVHVDHGQVNGDCAAVLRRAAEDLVPLLESRAVDSVGAAGRGNVTLTIVLADERRLDVRWPFRTEHPDARVRTLSALIYAIQCGGW